MIQDINEFIRLANEGNLRYKELQTQFKSNNQGVIGDLFVRISFGMGTAAMVDRLAHKATVINIKGDSYRVKETKDWLSN
jgi:DNA replication protein DnaC